MSTDPSVPAIEPAMHARIIAALADIEREHGVRILYAVESGSRAWGFASPDSDYDVRFLYVRPMEDYLSIRDLRDVIETPIMDLLDANGWDIRKALGLLCKSNAALLEWLVSPIVYREDGAVVAQIRRLAEPAEHRGRALLHYLSIARSQYRNFLGERDSVQLKKYFYCLRPALALLWLRQDNAGPVPMALPELLAAVDLSKEVRNEIDALLARKSVTNETGKGPPVPALNAFILDEMRLAEEQHARNEPTAVADIQNAAEALFRHIVLATSPGG